jgi:hypothetical protein
MSLTYERLLTANKKSALYVRQLKITALDRSSLRLRDLVQVFYKLLVGCIYERISRLIDSAHRMVDRNYRF